MKNMQYDEERSIRECNVANKTDGEETVAIVKKN